MSTQCPKCHIEGEKSSIGPNWMTVALGAQHQIDGLDCKDRQIASLQAIADQRPRTADGVYLDIFDGCPPDEVWIELKDCKWVSCAVVGWCAGAWESPDRLLLSIKTASGNYDDEWVDRDECWSTKTAHREAEAEEAKLFSAPS